MTMLRKDTPSLPDSSFNPIYAYGKQDKSGHIRVSAEPSSQKSVSYSGATDEELRNVYNDIPKFYDRANALISFFQDVKWRVELIKATLRYAEKFNIVLDVASGKGELSLLIKRILPVQLVMMDYAENMLYQAMVDGDRILASFYNMPFRGDAFDAVMSSFALHAADEIEEVIKEMVRVSKDVIGVIAMGKSDNSLFRAYVGFYLAHIQPWLASLVGAKVQDYRYIYYIYRRIPTNSQVRRMFERNLELKEFRVKTLGSVYIAVGKKRKGR
jgi:Methylase involved in ubiquinone/menaquinone biosynthesis